VPVCQHHYHWHRTYLFITLQACQTSAQSCLPSWWRSGWWSCLGGHSGLMQPRLAGERGRGRQEH
jgi:hypothetical protein